MSARTAGFVHMTLNNIHQ